MEKHRLELLWKRYEMIRKETKGMVLSNGNEMNLGDMNCDGIEQKCSDSQRNCSETR